MITVVPTGKDAPDALDDKIETVPQLSVAVGAVQDATAEVALVAAVTLTVAGHPAMTGAIESMKHGLVTMTLNEQVETFPFESEAV